MDGEKTKGVMTALKGRKGFGSKKGVNLLGIVQKLTKKREKIKSDGEGGPGNVLKGIAKKAIEATSSVLSAPSRFKSKLASDKANKEYNTITKYNSMSKEGIGKHDDGEDTYDGYAKPETKQNIQTFSGLRPTYSDKEELTDYGKTEVEVERILRDHKLPNSKIRDILSGKRFKKPTVSLDKHRADGD